MRLFRIPTPMEAPLVALFERQRFSKNEHLARLIAETEGRYGGTPLSEADLEQVWAAGEFCLPPRETKHDKP